MNMNTIALTLLMYASLGQTPPPAPQNRQREVDERGAHAMGFDQERTTHHFLLYDDGGAIDILVKDAGDAANRDAIRAHLPHIAALFAQGRFDLPHFIHATDVPGTADMTRLKDRLTYSYTATELGGRLDIVTTDAAALAAVHRFLTFQIEDHGTGDSMVVRKR